VNPGFRPGLLFLILCAGLLSRATNGVHAATKEGGGGVFKTTTPLFHEYCFKCHSDRKTKAHLNLERLGAEPDFAGLFKTWEKIITMLEEKEMPPEDEPQPSDAQRRELIGAVRNALDHFIREQQGDPGRIALRRLTSAEYAYSIQDLTGLELGLERNFISDAVGGEGFSNVGDVQFIQDSTLEHYLKAAQIVASHAVIGTGPVHFYRDPGKTGQELSAMARLQRIYREHGFRTGSGEGGKAFGLEHYPKAFYAAWLYRHREALGLKNITLPALAQAEGLDGPFVAHVWEMLQEDSAPFPSSEIAAAWKGLPAPTANDPAQRDRIRSACEDLYKLLQTWQTSFAQNTGDAEAAGLLTETSFQPSLTNSFRIRLSWPAGTSKATFQLAIAPALGKSNPGVVWREPAMRFRRPGQGLGAGGGRRQRGIPLRNVVSGAAAEILRFGIGRDGQSIGTNDFMTAGSVVLPIEFTIPEGMTQAELTMDARLKVPEDGSSEDCVVRCVLSHELSEGATAAASGTFSILLANPNGAGIAALKAGVAEFARNFPQMSHREAAPSDRDPIPAPFDNDYNNAERNEFHATIKYHRDDRFLTERILEPAARRELDQAWTDLLTAFDHHDIFLRFIAKKYQLGNLAVATLTQDRIDQLPAEPQPFVRLLRDQYTSAQKTLEAAAPGHVEDIVRFAERAWRRPLAQSEEERLRSFYAGVRKELDHPEALRALVARVLVAPAFLYRIENPPSPAPSAVASRQPAALGDWELASRLSYFLWCSIPDAELTRAAAAGELKSPAQLEQQAQRMLRDPKARRFAAEFFGQWFGFYRFDEYRGVDTTRFTEFTDELKTAMHEEAVSFFEYIVREDRPVSDILFADYSFLSPGLASHYEVASGALATNSNRELFKVEGVNRYQRGGLLRLGAVLTSTSAPLRTSAVKRGDWILRRVLGKSIPPPPGDAGSIPPDDVLDDGKTVRQRLEAHRRDASCVNCHARMDPLGFALEHFDSIGRWRDTYRDGQKIDASGRLNDGTEIAEFEGLNQYLRANETLFHRTLCAKLLGFALGRAELVSDRPLLEQMTAGLKTDSRFSTLVRQIVMSRQFRYRRAEEPTPVEPRRVAALQNGKQQ
jgi:hypothetical protein